MKGDKIKYIIPEYYVCAIEYGPDYYHGLTREEIQEVEDFRKETAGMYLSWGEERIETAYHDWPRSLFSTCIECEAIEL